MNLFNRFLLPVYFLSNDFLTSDFSNLQANVIIHLQCFANLALFAAAFMKKRFNLSRPIPYFIAIYLLVTGASPFVQPRYQYPVYVLLCIELACEPSVYCLNLQSLRQKRMRGSTSSAALSPLTSE